MGDKSGAAADDIEYVLYPDAFELEAEYFTDMTLADFPEIMDRLDRHGEGYLAPSMDGIRFHVIEPTDDTTGEYDTRNKTIGITANADITTVLHEMIHAYEHQIDGLNPAIRQYLAIKIWERVCQKVPNLDARVLEHLKPIELRELENEGGQHDVLFLLKSYDIDLRLGRELGTTMGYEYTKKSGVGIMPLT